MKHIEELDTNLDLDEADANKTAARVLDSHFNTGQFEVRVSVTNDPAYKMGRERYYNWSFGAFSKFGHIMHEIFSKHFKTKGITKGLYMNPEYCVMVPEKTSKKLIDELIKNGMKKIKPGTFAVPNQYETDYEADMSQPEFHKFMTELAKSM